MKGEGEWIVKGIYGRNILAVNFLLQESDLIIFVLNKNNFLISWRIIMRFFLRKKYDEDLKSLFILLKFQWSYKRVKKKVWS
jgi:hypothetical protein